MPTEKLPIETNDAFAENVHVYAEYSVDLGPENEVGGARCGRVLMR
jgi:hypothetical protein